LSWTDGTPTISSVNDTNGQSIAGMGNGFSFTAPADSSTRTLIVHVGGWNSGGTFSAQVSDSSAPDFVDTTAAVGGQYDRNYTLTYHAATAGQVLSVTWTMTSGAGNVTLSSAALAGGSSGGIATSISATGGTPQAATVNTAFAIPLRATVKDANNIPVSGATVTFTAPATGARGSFGGSPTATAVTNSSGVAAASAFTANSTAGSYTVAASVSGVATAANFSLTNNAASGGTGSLAGSGNSDTAGINLTTEGSADWVHWGDGTLNRKAGVTAQLSTYTVVGSAAVITYNNDPRPLSWTDGAPTASSTNNTNGVFVNGPGDGVSFTAPADTSTRILIVHVGGWSSGGIFSAHLSDGSAPDFVDTTAPVPNQQYDRNYTVTYNAATAGQTLTVTWTMTSGSVVSVNAAALQ
jgi:hypothetical protein